MKTAIIHLRDDDAVCAYFLGGGRKPTSDELGKIRSTVNDSRSRIYTVEVIEDATIGDIAQDITETNFE